MPYAYLGLGSNIGNRTENLQKAVDLLAENVAVVEVSSTYDSAPLLLESQPRFLNAVLKIYSEKTPESLLKACQSVEAAMGKKIEYKNGPRIIDIDLLFFGSDVVKDSGLTLPHPDSHKRRFVLEPLCEISPNLEHPSLKKTAKQLLSTALDQDVKKEGTLILFQPECEIFIDITEAESAVSSVGVEDTYSIKTMAQKTITKVVHLKGVRATLANILKQEMLSLGGDAAVHKDCISNKIDRSDVLLIGNLKQLRQLVSKLRVQVAEAQSVAKAVEKAIQ